MASTQASTLSPNFILTPQQQSLLLRALTSNQQSNGTPPNNALSLSPESLTQSPHQNGSLGGSSIIQESPFMDNYDYSFDADSSFDFDFGNVDGLPKMIGDLPGTNKELSEAKSDSPENDSAEKRGHEDDEEDDEGETNGAKRRESEGKAPKKPGRKPLTSEPTTKRKAQNRAAQRAFRERKEKHVKDLEIKVEELEKASQTTTKENSELRDRIERLTVELQEYKKRLSLAPNPRSFPNAARSGNNFGNPIINNLNDVNFQFEFPKFGVLPGPDVTKANGNRSSSRSQSIPSPGSVAKSMSTSPEASRKSSVTSPGASNQGHSTTEAQAGDALTKFSGFFNPPTDLHYATNMSRSSLDSGNFSLGANSTSSPSSSSNGNGGSSSSCGTSPEPTTQSPGGFKPLDTMATIGEETTLLAGGAISQDMNSTDLGSVDLNNFDWLSQQNGGQFDPQLFGGYREPQENILSGTTFDDSFFNDAFDVDFTTPFNMAASPALPKKDLISQIDQRKENEDTIVPASNGKLLTCNNIWEQLQGCPKVQNSEIDLDQLCSDLQKKAKCSGNGAVVDESDFKAIMSRHLGPGDENCPYRASSS